LNQFLLNPDQMNKLKAIAFFVALVTLSGTTFGQSNAIKINIFSPVVKTFNIAFEHALSVFNLGFTIRDIK
jgi:hypothetical protein